MTEDTSRAYTVDTYKEIYVIRKTTTRARGAFGIK